MTEVRGLVLAAGLGTRLRPLTEYVPKPLLPVDGVALLDRAAAALTAAGVERIAVNAHHRADRIAAHLAARVDHARFHLSLEPQILGTGGALDGARTFLAGAATVVVYNGDVLSDLDVGALLADHRRGGAVATLALTDWPDVNSVVLGADGVVRDVAGRLDAPSRADDRRLTFTGIACYDRAFLDRVPVGCSDLVAILTTLMQERPGAVRGFVHAGAWEDLGTLSRYLDAHRRLLGAGFASVGRDARVPADAQLDECVVLDGGFVPAGARLRRTVCGPGWAVAEHTADSPDLALAARVGFDASCEVAWITGHGSDRRFAHLRQGDRRAVLMQTTPTDPEFDRFLAVTGFLYDRGLGAAAIYARDPRARAVLMEDLGPDRLDVLAARDPAAAPALYDRVLDRLADLQTFGAEARGRCLSAWDRTFDHAYLRWETDYFRDRYLVGQLGCDRDGLANLDAEFEALAAACRRQPYTLVHRDFQSQNILLKDGVVRLVDAQGMRWGPMAYDAVSLLYDPYVALDLATRERLLASFPDRVAARGGRRVTADDWRAMTVAAGRQRLMQALGAFGFLGRVKGKVEFLAHAPAAAAMLRGLLGDRSAAKGTFAPPPMPRLATIIDAVCEDPDRSGSPR